MVTKLSLIIIIHLCCISFIFLPTTSYLLACHVSTYMNSQVTELYADNLEGIKSFSAQDTSILLQVGQNKKISDHVF